MSAIRVRVFEPIDRNGVVRLWQRVFPTPPPWNDPETDIDRKLAGQPELFFVAHAGEELVGACMAGYDGHRGWVYYLAVAPDRRRRGVGRALMGAVEAALSARGCHKMNLQVRAGGAEAVAFYERLGYRVEDHISMGKLLRRGS